MKAIKHNIGAILKLNVQDEVTVKGKSFYIVRYEDRLCRVAMEEWQVGQKTPSTLQCRLKSINDFGFPEFVQADIQERKTEPERKDSQISAFLRRFSFTSKARKTNEESSVATVSRTADVSEKKQLDDDKIVTNVKAYNSNPTTSLDYNDKSIYDYFWREQSEDFDQWFIASGGVGRRIDILISLANQLSKYHCVNKVYKDICPDFINVHITRDGKVKANLAQTDYLASGFDNLFVFASVAAPEIINKLSPNTPMSDCYSFAIIAHELLAFCHPFIGDGVVNYKKDLMEAYLGKLPWIDSPEDSSNRLTYRKYDQFFTTDKIRQLFAETFLEGQYSPLDRPSIHKWADALYDAKEHLHHCDECNTSYIFYKDECCPFCDKEIEPVIQVAMSNLDKKFDKELLDFSNTEMDIYTYNEDHVLLANGETLKFSTRQLLADSVNVRDMLSVSVKCLNEDTVNVIVEPLSGFTYYAANVQKQLYSHKIEKPTKVTFSRKTPKSLILAINEITTPQRVFQIRLN